MSILNPDQNQIMNRMTDEIIRSRIREYCTYDLRKYKGEQWVAANGDLKISDIGKDEQGWYVDTKSFFFIRIMENTSVKSFYDYCSSCGQKIDKQKGFLIEDIGTYFRWRRHKGTLKIFDCPNLEYTDGLPEELDALHLICCYYKKHRFEVHNKIGVIALTAIHDFNMSGDGCKNILLDCHLSVTPNIIAPNGTKIHKPISDIEYNKLMIILAKL